MTYDNLREMAQAEIERFNLGRFLLLGQSMMIYDSWREILVRSKELLPFPSLASQSAFETVKEMVSSPKVGEVSNDARYIFAYVFAPDMRFAMKNNISRRGRSIRSLLLHSITNMYQSFSCNDLEVGALYHMAQLERSSNFNTLLSRMKLSGPSRNIDEEVIVSNDDTQIKNLIPVDYYGNLRYDGFGIGDKVVVKSSTLPSEQYQLKNILDQKTLASIKSHFDLDSLDEETRVYKLEGMEGVIVDITTKGAKVYNETLGESEPISLEDLRKIKFGKKMDLDVDKDTLNMRRAIIYDMFVKHGYTHKVMLLNDIIGRYGRDVFKEETDKFVIDDMVRLYEYVRRR